jgi:hypothetical protein
MDASIFDQVTSALTIKSICSPLGPDIPARSTGFDLEMMGCDDTSFDPTACPFRVVNPDGSVIGIVWYGDFAELGSDETIEQVIEPLEPDQLLSSATTILEAVETFGSKPNEYFYVLQVNDIVGFVLYRDLFKPLGRLAFLALALEIEDQALTLCRCASIAERSWQSLSDNRKQKALELFRHRYEREPKLIETNTDAIRHMLFRTRSDISLLIGCTNLVDKATMIWKQKIDPCRKAR